MTKDPAIRALKELVKDGIVENSGERRPDKTGAMRVVWRLSPLGRIVAEYERLGLTPEQALAKAKAEARVQ